MENLYQTIYTKFIVKATMEWEIYYNILNWSSCIAS